VFVLQMLGMLEESTIDLQTLLKIDAANAAAKKELESVEKARLEVGASPESFVC
jgi:hypothetical protein